MAKVKCSLCGKKFDLYANASVCPECGCHYHEDGELSRSFEGSHEHGELHSHYDGGNYNHGRYDGAGQKNYDFDGASLENKHYDGAGFDNKHYDGVGEKVKYDGAGEKVKYDGAGLEHSKKNVYDANKVRKEYHERQKAGMGSISGVYGNRSNTVRTVTTVKTNTSNANTLTKNDLKTGKRFVVFIIMIFVFINFCSIYRKICDEIRDHSVKNQYGNTDIDTADIMHYDMGIWEYWTIEDVELCVTDAFIIRDNKVVSMYRENPCGEEMKEFANCDWSRIPEGYEVVGYRYQLDSDVHTFYEMSKIFTPYMVTTDGQYLKSVDAYYWEKIMSDSDATWLKNWVGYGMEQSDGVILFLVRERTADHLMLDIRPGDDSDGQSNVIYKMDVIPAEEASYE